MTDARRLASLFRVPPEELTAARNRLVPELRRTGETAAVARRSDTPGAKIAAAEEALEKE